MTLFLFLLRVEEGFELKEGNGLVITRATPIPGVEVFFQDLCESGFFFVFVF